VRPERNPSSLAIEVQPEEVEGAAFAAPFSLLVLENTVLDAFSSLRVGRCFLCNTLRVSRTPRKCSPNLRIVAKRTCPDYDLTMSDDSDVPPTIPPEILRGLLEDAESLATCAQKVKSIVINEESREQARRNFIELNQLLEKCLECTINLMDLDYPTRPRVDLTKNGYDFVSGETGFRVFKPLMVEEEK
jgi:hypothetical protein